MKFIDHLLAGDIDEITPYLASMDHSKYYTALCELSDIIRKASNNESSLKNLVRKLDCEETTFGSTCDTIRFDGNPRTEDGKAWIRSVAKRYNLDEESESSNMLRNAISICEGNEQTAINPKRDKRNYNRYIANEIGMHTECFCPCDCLAFITTSSEYAFDEQDIQQIMHFLKDDHYNLIIHPRIDQNCGEGLEIDIFICTRDYNIQYETDPARVEQVLDELFDYEIPPLCIYRSDFDRVINHYDLYRIAQLTSQCGIDGMLEQLKSVSRLCTIPTAQTATLCIEYRKEHKGTFHELTRILDTIKELMPHAMLTWGARENCTLPENGYQITILTDIPDDYYQLHLVCSTDEV